MKKRCGQARPPELTPPAALPVADFIEVKAEPAWLATAMAIDLQRPDGTRLHLDYREPQPPVAAVIQTFLESH